MAQAPNVIEVHETTFEQDVLQKSHEKTVVVDFWAAWCGPCRMLGPILERLANEPDNNFILAKVDVDRNQGLSMRFGVQGIPAVKAFRDGQMVGGFVGAQPEPMVRKFIEEVAPGQGSESSTSAEKLLADRKWQEAEEQYRQLLEQDPVRAEAKIGMAKALIGQSKGCKAQFYLEDARNSVETLETAERLLPLANYSCMATKQVDADVDVTVIEAQYRQAAVLFNKGKYAAALDGLLDVLRQNRNYRDGQAKAVVLGMFELLGDEDRLTQAYRRELASILF